VHKEASEAASGQKLFESAVKAYRQDDCHAALELLDRYLADHSGSPLAADATLYKADCYLKLSAQ
jgi:outer membrane protein assembly factor BamD (BamD/ComL family)